MSAAAPRVLQVVLQLDPGGTERLVIDIVRRLYQRFPTAVCCLDQPGQWAPQVTSLGVAVSALNRSPGFRPSLAWQLAKVAARTRAQVLHCHHYSPFVYGRLASLLRPGTRVVFTEHGRLSDTPPSAKRRAVNRFLMRGVSALYAVSHDLRRHLLLEGFPDRLGVIWNGIEPGAVPDEEARRRARSLLEVSPTDIVVGTVGRLDPVKDFPTLVTAFATAHAHEPRLRLVLVGAGSERPLVEERLRSVGVEAFVHLMGQRDDVRELLPGFDIYANSSISEGVSLTLLEAMAAELPVVATRVGGTPEVVQDGQTGLLSAARAPEELARLLLELASSTTTARDLGKAGRRRVLEHFTIDRMVERYAAIYEGSID